MFNIIINIYILWILTIAVIFDLMLKSLILLKYLLCNIYIYIYIYIYSFRGYFETELGTCEPCDELCLTCDGTSTQCLSCREGLHLGNGQCKQNCGPMSYMAEDGTCRRCAPHCDVCTDFTTCTSEWSLQLRSFKRVVTDTSKWALKTYQWHFNEIILN